MVNKYVKNPWLYFISSFFTAGHFAFMHFQRKRTVLNLSLIVVAVFSYCMPSIAYGVVFVFY